MTKEQLFLVALGYLKKNPYRFNEKEKAKFMQGLRDWSEGKMLEIDDEIYDFLIDIGLYNGKRREEEFISYLNQKFGVIKFRKILDVGAGRMCKLSESLVKMGNILYAMDPKIRLSETESKKLGLRSIKKQNFECDQFAKSGKGTNIQGYDYIFALEPCDATEHIIRQGLKYDKPFEILLCGAPHDALSGKTFSNYHDWYDYLDSISQDVEIQKCGKNYYASNVNFKGFEKE